MIDRTFFARLKQLFAGQNDRKHLSLFLLITIAPLVFVAGYSIKKEFEHIDREIFSRSKATVGFSAKLVEEHLNRMRDIGVSLATRPLVERGAERGRWADVEEVLHDAPNSFPYVDSIAILDKEGTLQAIIPASPSVIGKSFVYRDYYQAVIKDWQPHISSVFKKKGGDHADIVSVVVPIWSTDDRMVSGVLLLGIKLDAIAAWSSNFTIGEGDMAYIVDQKETSIISNKGLLEHADESLHKRLSHKAVHEGLGTEIVKDQVTQESFVAAHAPVVPYGWGVVLMRPTDVAFADRTAGFLRLVVPWMLVLVFIAVLLYLLLKDRAELCAERDHEQMFLDSIGDGVIAIDRNWNITLWNRAAGVISGWSAKEAIGKPFRSIVKFLKEPDRTEHITFIEDAMVSGNVRSVDRGLILVRKDGSEVTVSDSAAAVVNMHGQSEGAIIVFRDVTREREAERMRSDFAYAAHQLRTPVTEALWNIEIAQKEHTAKKRNESLAIAHEALLNVKDLEEHLITVSEIDKGIVVPCVSYVKLREMFADIERVLLPKASEHKVKLSIDYSQMPEAVNTDQKLLKAALSEVIENAIMYSREGGTVVVRGAYRDENIIFEVEDYGVGVSPEEQPIVFTKFFRGSNHGARNVGSGLGLFVAKEYVRVLGGKIWFTSEEGKGTTFFVSIPMR